jgi:hypothetical protein
VNGKQLKLVLAFCLVTFAASIIGPVLGEALTQRDTLAWQLLPWALLAAVGLGLYVWSRRAQRPS